MSDGIQTTFAMLIVPALWRAAEGCSMIMSVSRVSLLLFPNDDARFAARVESLTGVADSHGFRRLEHHLRYFYPDAVVRQRDALGELDPCTQTWYVYRDGSPSAGHA